MPQQNQQNNISTLNELSLEPEEPKKFNVIILNDDYTPIGFVVSLLMQVLSLSKNESNKLAKDIHSSGKCVCGTFTKEIAEMHVIK